MKLRFGVIIAALLLLVVVIGWFLAGDDSLTPARTPVKSRSVSAPPASVSSPAPHATSPAPAPPVVQSSPPAPVAQVPMAVPLPIPAKSVRSDIPPANAAPRMPATNSAPSSPPSADATAQALLDMDKVSLMIRDFRTLDGTNPVGTNAEIMKAVMGGNSKRAMLGPPEGQNLNANGELVDRWGTPYFFHQMSATHMEIHSAGPDRIFSSPDDIIQR